MAGDFKIFTEGKADKRFLEDYIFHRFNVGITNDIIALGGKDNLRKTSPQFQQNTEQGRKNILIFDANGNFADREKDIREKASEYKIVIDDLFLLPNHSESGNLETLLFKITSPKFNLFFDCFESYIKCLETERRFTIPDNKVKLYAYNYSLLPRGESEKASDTKRSYLNSEYWNLKHESLEPLNKFLSKYFT